MSGDFRHRLGHVYPCPNEVESPDTEGPDLASPKPGQRREAYEQPVLDSPHGSGERQHFVHGEKRHLDPFGASQTYPGTGVGSKRSSLDGGSEDKAKDLAGGTDGPRPRAASAKVGKVLADVGGVDATDGPAAEVWQDVDPQHRCVANLCLQPKIPGAGQPLSRPVIELGAGERRLEIVAPDNIRFHRLGEGPSLRRSPEGPLAGASVGVAVTNVEGNALGQLTLDDGRHGASSNQGRGASGPRRRAQFL